MGVDDLFCHVYHVKSDEACPLGGELSHEVDACICRTINKAIHSIAECGISTYQDV